MRYKVGDKVRVRKDLVADFHYGEDAFTSAMEKYLGKIMTISSIVKNCKYRLKEDIGYWNWTEEMLEDVEDITILVRNNKVIAKMGDKVGVAKCSPEDEFDIFTGAKLAIERLEEKCNPYSWLKYGVRYYVPSFIENNFCTSYTYRDDPTDKNIKERGLIFKTEEEAIKCAKKMLKVVK